MKGVILAGGLGTRLYPLTKITNKHLLPVYDKPMIYYPIEMFVKAGVTNIMIVSGGNHLCSIFEMLGDGVEFGATFEYTIQAKSNGIAGALSLARGFIKESPFAVCLGDNIFGNSIKQFIDNWNTTNAKIFVKEVETPESYGVLYTEPNLHIVEKPEEPKSNLAVTGFYLYPPNVFDYIDTLTPSQRNELEITDINNIYIKQGKLEYDIIDGIWLDAGESIDALFEASKIIKENR